MTILFRILLIIISANIASCSHPPELATEATDNKPAIMQFNSVEEAFQEYRAALTEFMSTVSDKIAEQADPLFPLSVIKGAVYAHIYWGYLNVNGETKAFTPGNTNGCWVTFISDKHPLLKSRGATLGTGIRGQLVTVLVRPDRISRKWAGILLIHELSHAYELMYTTQRPKEQTEFFAYDLEKLAFNHLTHGHLDQVLDEVIARTQLTDHRSIKNLFNGDREHVYKILAQIEAELGESKPASVAEAEMRDGFYLMSLALRVHERSNSPLSIRAASVNDLIKKVSFFPVNHL